MRHFSRSASIGSAIVGAIALLVLAAGAAAMAQGGAAAGGSTAATDQSRSGRDAPVGHRQPRPDQLRSENDANNANDPLSKENALLDRKIRGICRGC
jgi:hypothetical protein